MNPTYLLPLLLAILSPQDPTDQVTVGADDTVVDRSCTVQISAETIPDANGDGVIHIRGKGLVVDFAGAHLGGAAPGSDPDTRAGIGVHVTGKNITIKGLAVSGFKVGIYAEGVDGLVIEGCDVSDNFAQRLHSTPEAEDGRDWLWPHANDDQEWMNNYGAGIYLAGGTGVTVKECRARRTQNGLIIDRVNESRFFDNDFSFLSGWGMAMWRSSRNVVTRNQFDFCVRGYSHGVYNRGQDSAGILMFEQCSENVIAQNSASHCGDGFFGFAGREALGENPPPTEDFDYARRGNCDNMLVMNDFSHNVAHGIEMTFSFGNQFVENRLWGNAICGIWGGYSKGSRIIRNQIGFNGDMAYGAERGGINIEHGRLNLVAHNKFYDNKCGVFFWWDSDPDLEDLPWTKANGGESKNNQIISNEFHRDELAIELRNTLITTINNNTFQDVKMALVADDEKQIVTQTLIPPATRPEFQAFGKSKPLLKREHLGRRDAIVMTEWGPYDHETPLLQRLSDKDGAHVYRLFGPDRLADATATGPVTVRVERPERGPVSIHVTPDQGAGYGEYELTAKGENGPVVTKGTFLQTIWNVRAFAYETDPREDLDAWHAEAETAIATTIPDLRLRFGGRGPSELVELGEAVAQAGIAGNRFGILAETKLSLPAGAWQLKTKSDDGIRVWVDGEVVLEDWTHHGPTSHDAELTFAEAGEHEIRVEYFELDGHAELVVGLQQAN